MAFDLVFTDEEMAIDEGLGYPKAYAKLCRDRSISPYINGPPFTFTPYALQQQEALTTRDLDEMFPIIDPKAKPTAKPKIFVSLLWKQLNHLGNAGFDPAVIRVDPYGNVLYYHADSASPLAWDIDHWFPCSRGGLTVPSNLRILQWQVGKKKHNKLEFLIPWWDLQVGISINQFLSIFASSNSDFRHRAFSLLFADGETEELNDSLTVDSHTFPQHFIESKERIGLAPAAVVSSRRESYDSSSVLKSLDINRRPRSNTPIIASRKLKLSTSKENENPDNVTNPYQAIVLARDSLRHREETAKMQSEIQKLDDEVNDLKQRAEEEKFAIQELELVLIKRRRRVEKCRRLAEAQSSYRAMLEKMIRDAMHQSVIYKEQVRLNQAASNALMARLEAQKTICDSSEKELHRRFRQRDELEKQIRPQWEQARKRSRMDDTFYEEKEDKTVLYLPGNKIRASSPKEMEDTVLNEKDDKPVLFLPGTENVEGMIPLHKELRVFLEEEQKASEAGLSLNEERKEEEIEEIGCEDNNVGKEKQPEECNKAIVATEDGFPIEEKLRTLKIEEGGKTYNIRIPVICEAEVEEDEESRKQRGKGNVEKWLQMLLDTQEGTDSSPQNAGGNEASGTDEMIRKLNLKYPQKEIKVLRFPESLDVERVKQVHQEKNQQIVQTKDAGKRQEEIVETEASSSTLLKSPPYKLKAHQEKNQQIVQTKDAGKRQEEIVKTEASSSTLLKTPPYKLKAHQEKNQQIVQMKDSGKREVEIVKIEASSSTILKSPPYKLQMDKSDANEVDSVGKGVGSRNSFEGKEKGEKNGKERGLERSESARTFRRIPSSPSLILGGMRKGVDCMRKKPLVIGDDDGNEDHATGNSSFIKSSIKTIKKAVKI
ncbi:uncharacterized protein LOC132286282 [Cornus florida]|uniref:uncharacterized protein LOC132286282 n=1 Tax=Cornus florida TaxID=4283 RepID=UPI00289C13A5|nr:uncharacterized protein LOC132286282 [Cornus florida]